MTFSEVSAKENTNIQSMFLKGICETAFFNDDRQSYGVKSIIDEFNFCNNMNDSCNLGYGETPRIDISMRKESFIYKDTNECKC